MAGLQFGFALPLSRCFLRSVITSTDRAGPALQRPVQRPYRSPLPRMRFPETPLALSPKDRGPKPPRQRPRAVAQQRVWAAGKEERLMSLQVVPPASSASEALYRVIIVRDANCSFSDKGHDALMEGLSFALFGADCAKGIECGHDCGDASGLSRGRSGGNPQGHEATARCVLEIACPFGSSRA